MHEGGGGGASRGLAAEGVDAWTACAGPAVSIFRASTLRSSRLPHYFLSSRDLRQSCVASAAWAQAATSRLRLAAVTTPQCPCGHHRLATLSPELQSAWAHQEGVPGSGTQTGYPTFPSATHATSLFGSTTAGHAVLTGTRPSLASPAWPRLLPTASPELSWSPAASTSAKSHQSSWTHVSSSSSLPGRPPQGAKPFN